MNGRINRPEPDSTRVGLPRVGNIKIGMKDAKGFPRSVDYFVPTGKYAELFTKAYGEKPQTIQIVFPDDDPAKVCSEKYEYRDDEGRLIAFGDGETFKVWNGKTYAEYSATDYPTIMKGVAQKHPNRDVRKGGDGWQITLTVTFIIPMIRGIAGVWQFVSKGTASTIPNIRDTFDAMLKERGFVRGVIFDMNVQFATSQKPGDRSRYPVVTIVPNESEDNLRKVLDAKKPIQLLE